MTKVWFSIGLSRTRIENQIEMLARHDDGSA